MHDATLFPNGQIIITFWQKVLTNILITHLRWSVHSPNGPFGKQTLHRTARRSDLHSKRGWPFTISRERYLTRDIEIHDEVGTADSFSQI